MCVLGVACVTAARLQIPLPPPPPKKKNHP